MGKEEILWDWIRRDGTRRDGMRSHSTARMKWHEMGWDDVRRKILGLEFGHYHVWWDITIMELISQYRPCVVWRDKLLW